MASTKLKTSFELTDELTKPPTPPAEPSNPEREKITREMEQAERDFRATQERCRAENMALGERRRPACEAIDRLRRLVEVARNGRRYMADAKARAEVFHALVLTQLGGGGGDLNLLNNIASNDPAAASAERLVNILLPWLESREQELVATLAEAKRLAADAPDNAGLLSEVAQLSAAVA